MANHATARTVLCLPLDSLTDLDVGLSGERGMEKLTKGPSYVYSRDFSPNFTIGLSSCNMPKGMAKRTHLQHMATDVCCKTPPWI